MRNRDPQRENVENILAICLPIMTTHHGISISQPCYEEKCMECCNWICKLVGSTDAGRAAWVQHCTRVTQVSSKLCVCINPRKLWAACQTGARKHSSSISRLVESAPDRCEGICNCCTRVCLGGEVRPWVKVRVVQNRTALQNIVAGRLTFVFLDHSIIPWSQNLVLAPKQVLGYQAVGENSRCSSVTAHREPRDSQFGQKKQSNTPDEHSSSGELNLDQIQIAKSDLIRTVQMSRFISHDQAWVIFLTQLEVEEFRVNFGTIAGHGSTHVQLSSP